MRCLCPISGCTGLISIASLCWAAPLIAQEAVASTAAAVVSAEAAAPPPATQSSSTASERVSDEGSPSGDYLHRYAPTDNLAEIGAFAGLLFISDNNSFRGSGSVTNGVVALRPYSEFKKPAPEFGARVGYFPLSFLGGELEGMIATASAQVGSGTTVLAGRVQAVVQAPMWSVIPFVAGGAGYWATLSRSPVTTGTPPSTSAAASSSPQMTC